jgi:predicted PurR-regulated permease PerM
MSRRPLTVGLGVVALCAAVFMLQFTAAVLIPLVVSLLLFYALDPLVKHLVRWKVPRPPAALIVMLSFVGGIGAGGWVLWPQIEQVVDDIPQGAAELRRELRQARGGDKSTLQRVQEAAKAIDAAAAEAASPPLRTPGVTAVEVLQPVRASDLLWSSGVSALTLVGQSLTVLFLTVFLLSEGDSFKRKFVRRLETRVKQRLTVSTQRHRTPDQEVFLLGHGRALPGRRPRHGFALCGGSTCGTRPCGAVCRRDERGALFRPAARHRGARGGGGCRSSAR